MKRDKLIKLNLGCWLDKLENYINIDSFAGCQPDMVADLNKRLPFADGKVSEILAFDIMEHLEDPKKFLHECHRVLASGGILQLGVPHYKDPSAYHPQHKTFFSLRWFTRSFEQGYTEFPPFKMKEAKLIFTVKPNPFLEFIPNLRPLFWERFFPVVGLRITLEKIVKKEIPEYKKVK